MRRNFRKTAWEIVEGIPIEDGEEILKKKKKFLRNLLKEFWKGFSKGLLEELKKILHHTVSEGVAKEFCQTNFRKKSQTYLPENKKKKMAMKLPKKVLAGSNEIAKVILKENAPELSKEFLGIAEQIHKRI